MAIKSKGGKDKLLIFAASLKPEKMRKLFRERRGVEKSCRMMRKFHANTTSKLYRLRILCFHLAVTLYNCGSY